MNIPSLEQLREYDENGLITVRSLDDLIIANYTPKCAYSQAWDNVTTACRGLILRVDRSDLDHPTRTEIVALPFPKFFNVGENGQYPNGSIVDVTEKVDGSLGILYRHRGDYRIATRGTFDSDQAQWATRFLKRFDLDGLPSNYTLLFEIVYPGNRIVVDYGGREDLVLLGIRDRYSGADLSYRRLVDAADHFGFSLPDIYPDIRSVQDALRRSKELDARTEGWVLRFDDGSRWKVKGDAYREISRLLAHATPASVVDAMIDGTIEPWLGTIPEEYRGDVTQWRKETDARVRAELARLTTLLADAPTATRKDFALWAKAEHPSDAPLLFGLLDGKDIRVSILKIMRRAMSG